MNFSFSWLILCFCRLTLAQDDGYGIGTEKPIETRQCSPDMCDLLREFGAMSEKLRVMETRLIDSETRLRDSEIRLRDSEIRLKDSETRLRDSETRLKDSENEIADLRRKERTKVIFSAATGGGNTNIGPFNTDTTLIYRTVKTNIGDAFSHFTGIFIAPVEGVYYFSIFYHAGYAHGALLTLYKNNQKILMTHDHSSDYDRSDNGGNAVFLQLQRGDQVYVRLAASTHVWGTDYHTTFSGFLVTQM